MKNSLESNAESTKHIEIVEIGPGLGDLSVKILDYFNLIAYEVDSELCSYLEDRFPKDKLRLYNKDILSLHFSDNGWLCNREYILVSNLPYYIATKIVLNVLRDKMCRGMVVMTQKEVADKFCANTGDREFCAISVIAQSVGYDIRKIALVPPTAFSPAPKVESSIFSILKNTSFIPSGFEDFLKAAFSSPRKRLAKNLFFIKNIDELLNTLNIASNTRAHQVNTLQYHQIFEQGYNIWKKIKMKD